MRIASKSIPPWRSRRLGVSGEERLCRLEGRTDIVGFRSYPLYGTRHHLHKRATWPGQFTPVVMARGVRGYGEEASATGSFIHTSEGIDLGAMGLSALRLERGSPPSASVRRRARCGAGAPACPPPDRTRIEAKPGMEDAEDVTLIGLLPS
jgi:hypothetical protein